MHYVLVLALALALALGACRKPDDPDLRQAARLAGQGIIALEAAQAIAAADSQLVVLADSIEAAGRHFYRAAVYLDSALGTTGPEALSEEWNRRAGRHLIIERTE